MRTITATQKFFKLIVKDIPPQLKKTFEFGFKAISIQPISSLNANARSTVKNHKTAESKIYRLTLKKNY